MTPNTKKALGYWQVAMQYLDLSENVSNLISESGNNWVYIQDGFDINELEENYKKATKWTDYNQGIPVIFNFYHGIEVLLKGFLVAADIPLKGHSLTAILNKTKSAHPNAEFIEIIEKYLHENKLPEIIKNFVNETSISIDEWYQAFKYPESNNGSIYAHDKLQFQTENGADFFGDLAKDIHEIRIASVKYAHGKYEGLA